MHIAEPVKHIADTAAVTVTAATFFNMLPDATALLALLWIIMRMYVGWLDIVLKRQEIRENKEQ